MRHHQQVLSTYMISHMFSHFKSGHRLELAYVTFHIEIVHVILQMRSQRRTTFANFSTYIAYWTILWNIFSLHLRPEHDKIHQLYYSFLAEFNIKIRLSWAHVFTRVRFQIILLGSFVFTQNAFEVRSIQMKLLMQTQGFVVSQFDAAIMAIEGRFHFYR